MVAKSHIWPDARSYGNASKSKDASAPAGANDKHEDTTSKPSMYIPVAVPAAKDAKDASAANAAPILPSKSAKRETSTSAKPESAEKDSGALTAGQLAGAGTEPAIDDKVRTNTFPPAQLEPRKWRAWTGANAPGETPDDDVELAEHDVDGPPIDEEAHKRDLEVGWQLLHPLLPAGLPFVMCA